MQAVLFILFIFMLQGGQSSVCNTYLQVLHNAKGQVDQYKYGDTIHFICELHNQTDTEIDNLFLWNIENQTKIPISNTEGNTSYTDVKVVSKKSGGTYSCRYGNCSEDTLLSALIIKIDGCSFPRKEDSRKPSLTCIVNDLDNMTCDWAVNGNSNCTIWEARFKTEVQDMYKCCTADGSRNCTSTKAHCQIKDDDFHRFIQYNISLTGISEHGKKTYYYTKVPDDSIVQIYLDKDVRVRQGNDPYTLVIGFTLHHPPDAVDGMFCSVSYTSEWDRNDTVTSAHNLTQSELDVTITLDKLTPFTNYTVGIVCKPLASPYWSNRISGFGRTRPAVCDSVPDIIGYSDVRTDIAEQRKVYLYLKPLERRQWYGLRTRYLVSVDFEDTFDIREFSADSITCELNETFATNQSYTVYVRTENEAGVSNLSVRINISSTDMQDMSSLTVVAEETTEGSHVILFPEHTVDNSSVRYYFCLGEQNTYPPVCKTDLQSETTSTFLLPEKLKHMENYILYYGVSEYRSNTLSSNRILWSNCVFHKNGRRMTSTKQLEVHASLLPSNKTVVILSPNFKYCQLKHRPLSYYVGFWETDRNISNHCRNRSAELKHFTATPSTRMLQVYIGRLTEVTLCMKVQYNGQSDVIEDIVPALPSTGNSVVSPTVKETEKDRTIIIAAVCSLIFTILLAVLIRFSRNRIKELVNRNKIPDEIIARILQDSPEDTPTQNCLWLNSDDSSGVFTRSTEDQTEVKRMCNNHSSSSGFKEISRLESDTFVHSEDDNTNTVDDYLEPHINSRNSFHGQVVVRNIEERRISSGDGYLVATSRLRDEPLGDTVRDDVRNMTNEVENQLNFSSVSADMTEDLRRGIGEDSDILPASEYQQAVALIPVSVNSSNVSSFEYLLAHTQAVPSNRSIPLCWQSFDVESYDGIRNLRVPGHAAATNEAQEYSSFGQESSSCDEYTRVCGEDRTTKGSRFSTVSNWPVCLDVLNDDSNLQNSVSMRVLSLGNLRTGTHGSDCLKTCNSGFSSGDETTLSVFQSADEYQQALSWSGNDRKWEVASDIDSEETSRENEFQQPPTILGTFQGIQSQHTLDICKENQQRHFETEDLGTEQNTSKSSEKTFKTSVEKGQRNEMSSCISFSKEDIQRALELADQILKTNEESAPEQSVDSYTMADF